MNKMIILLLIVFSGSALASNDIDERCNLPESLCKLQLNFEASDKALNDVYKTIIKKIKTDGYADALVDKTELKTSLVNSQRAWLKFKKQNCDAVFTLNSGGTGRDWYRMECEIKMTDDRTHYLQNTYLY